MAQWLIALVPLQRTWAQFAEPTWQLTNICNCSSRRSSDIFWHLLAQDYTYMDAGKTFIHLK